jgi:lipopolysaccharide biosynthesis glycosyltransferase
VVLAEGRACQRLWSKRDIPAAGNAPEERQRAMKLAFVYVIDERGFELATHSAISLVLSQRSPCDIHMFCYQFSPTLSSRLSAALAELRATLTLHPIRDALVEQHQTCGHVTTPSLLKVSAIEKLVGQCDRVIYLDHDLLVFDDLKIEDIEFGDVPIAAVIDMDLSDTGALRHTKWSMGGGTEDDIDCYFNVGFMIVESKNWLRETYRNKYASALDRHDISCRYKIRCTSIEQCALNSVFEDNWIRLPVVYNMQASAKFTKSWRTALVRHYCGARKFLPIAMFRSDRRDVRFLNEIKRTMGLPAVPFCFLYEIPFLLNAARKYRSTLPMRRFLRATEV